MLTGKTVTFYTLGCKLNFAETSGISRQFSDSGFRVVNFDQGADVYVVNTCSVTDNADKKCRNIIRRAKSKSPNSYVIIVGCYAQLKPKEISQIPGVNMVLGANEKFNILDHLDFEDLKPQVRATDIGEVNTFTSSFSFGERTRSFLKVQDGCDYSCTFCTIPLARGKSRSDTIASVCSEARKVADMGAREIVLTGVNIGDFGSKEETFTDLVKELDKTEDIDRFRISSIEPNLLTDEIIEFTTVSERFMPHFHIPLQSGSDKILAAMRRRYQRKLYTDRVTKIKEIMPHACIGVDVIVGFPGETHEDFLETYNFLNELDVSYLHVFTYSERDNTPAIDMDGAVPLNERRERSQQLRSLSEKKRRAFYEQHLGTSRPVLFEDAVDDLGNMNGFTDNYIKVVSPYSPELANTIVEVDLNAIDNQGEVTINIPMHVR